MSFLPDLAGWALSGGAGSGNGNNNNDNNNNSNEGGAENDDSTNDNQQQQQQETEEEIRAKRISRLAARFGDNEKPDSIPNNGQDQSSMEIGSPTEDHKMVIDENDNKNDIGNTQKQPETISPPSEIEDEEMKPASNNPPSPKKISKSDEPAATKRKRDQLDPTQKLQRKRELLLKKILNINLKGGFVTSPECIQIDLEGASVEDGNIAEILSTRLALPLTLLQSTSPKERNLVSYLAGCHKKASEELKNAKAESLTGNEDFLKEMKNQVVSFAASSLMVPDLFESGKDGINQLTECLTSASLDPAASITMGVSGKNSSFYACLCEELYSQDQSTFESVIQGVSSNISESLSKCETILDSANGSGILQVSALMALCSCKRAAAVLTKITSFLLPPANSPQASEKILVPINLPDPGPNASQQEISIHRMMTAMAQGRQSSYLARSGPALEKKTLLGLIMRIGAPMDNSAINNMFQNVTTRTRNDIKKTTDGLRLQLKSYQDAVYALVKAMITAGEEARKPVMQWFIDALLVNIGATAFRPDKTKVSNPQTLQNISVVLLKLCDPFMDKPSRVDPGFVCSPEHHGGIYEASGDNAVQRLNADTDAPVEPYNPKNAFIPMCFFLCARSLHLAAVSSASHHNSLVRQVRHMGWSLRQRNADIANDPQFNSALSMQYANEVSILAPELIVDTLRFFNLSAGFLLQIQDELLPLMPEHMVEDICAYVVFVTRHAGKEMSRVELGNIFKTVVKLLSPKFARTVKNYNLRAKLGDVLHDVYLPTNNDNDIPSSVSCDPKAGGQTYLLSDLSAQETLAPSLLLLYGEVEHTGYYEKMSHRANIASLLQYLWESKEHRPAFRRITQNKDSFIKFANGIMNEMNSLIASVMEKLPEIRRVQVQMRNPTEWNAMPEEERETISSRHEENEQEVKQALPLCNKTLKMLGFLSTDSDIRNLFLLEEMCPRLVNMLFHVMVKLVGARGMELKVDNPDSYNFQPREMLTDLCSIFSCYAEAQDFQTYCAKSGYYTDDLMQKAVKTCSKLSLLKGETKELFLTLPAKVKLASKNVEDDEELYVDAPDEFLDPLMCTFMKDPVLLPTSNTIIDRATITQHLLNDAHDPFNRKELSIDMIQPDVELKERMTKWVDGKREERKNKMQE